MLGTYDLLFFCEKIEDPRNFSVEICSAIHDEERKEKKRIVSMALSLEITRCPSGPWLSGAGGS